MLHYDTPCADLGVLSGGGGGGGGVQVRWPENSLDKLFFFPFFYSSTYFTVFRGVQCFYRFIREKTIIFQEPKFPGGGGGRGFQNVQGGPTFSRGGGGGTNANFYRNPYNL